MQDLLKFTAQKTKFSVKDFFSKCDQIRSFLRIWSHLLKKFLMENFIFSTVIESWNTCKFKKIISILGFFGQGARPLLGAFSITNLSGCFVATIFWDSIEKKNRKRKSQLKKSKTRKTNVRIENKICMK